MGKRPSIAHDFERIIRRAITAPVPARRTRGGARPTPQRNPHIEKYQQHDGCKLLASIGAAVYTIGTRRSRGKPCPHCKTFVTEDQGTRQTPGIADVLAFLPPPKVHPAAPRPSIVPVTTWLQLWWEAKHADGGHVSKEQKEFREFCRLSAQAHCVGPYDALHAWLIEHGYLRADRVPHYRLPGARS